MADYYPEQDIPEISTLAHELRANIYWRDKRMEFTSGNLIYKGTHRQNKADTADTLWAITKYTWTGTDLTRIQGPLPGAWDNRESLDWS